MKPQKPTTKRIWETTKQHMSRNKWLSIATITVISITFTIATIFAALVVVSSRTISEFEKRAQVIIFFQNHTTEEDINATKQTLMDTGLVSQITYISENEAVDLYKDFYKDDEVIAQTATTEDVLPSLELRAKSLEDIPQIKDICDGLSKQHSYINSVMYFEDLVDTLRGISKVIKIGGAILISSLATMSVVLILITIGFNINAHKHEIEVMQLIGSPEGFIKVPFLLEGTIYGIIGAAISTVVLLGLWYGVIALLHNNDMYVFITQTFNDVNMSYLVNANVLFIGGIFLVEVVLGSIIGYTSSSIALWKYLK